MKSHLQEIFNGPKMFYNGLYASPDIPKTMDRVVAAMTNRLRDMSSHKIRGPSITVDLYVRVSWLWLLLSGFFIILETLLLVSVMITTRKHKLPIWKTSKLALHFFHGLDFRVGDTAKMHKASEMEDVASTLQVRLGLGSGGELKLERKSE